MPAHFDFTKIGKIITEMSRDTVSCYLTCITSCIHSEYPKQCSGNSYPTQHHCVPEQKPTSFEDHAVIGDLVACLQAGAIPAVTSELVLALVDGDLDALDGGGRDVRVAHADVLLAAVQARQCA